MKLIDLKNSLAQNPGMNLRFVLPNGAEYSIDAAKGLEMLRVCLPAE